MSVTMGEDCGTEAVLLSYGQSFRNEQEERRQEQLEMLDSIPRESDRAVAAMAMMDGRRLSYSGGYPSAISEEVRGYVIVASPGEENGVSLTIHRRADLVRWYRRARRLMKEDATPDVVEAMGETQE